MNWEKANLFGSQCRDLNWRERGIVWQSCVIRKRETQWMAEVPVIFNIHLFIHYYGDHMVLELLRGMSMAVRAQMIIRWIGPQWAPAAIRRHQVMEGIKRSIR